MSWWTRRPRSGCSINCSKVTSRPTSGTPGASPCATPWPTSTTSAPGNCTSARRTSRCWPPPAPRRRRRWRNEFLAGMEKDIQLMYPDGMGVACTSQGATIVPRRVSLSLDLLHTFLSLLRHEGDAADTARELGINQPSMSKRLSFLQHAGRVLKKPWLQRAGKRWRLTEEGQRVLPAVEDIVQRYEQLQEFVEQPAGAQVSFACGQQAAGAFVQRAVTRFAAAHPE